jgi:hypothetical protein
MPAPVTAGATPVWTSNQQITLAVGFVTGVAALFPKSGLVERFGLGDPVKVTGYINLGLTGLSLLSILGASALRYFSKVAPQVLSWKAALAHPATQALLQTQQKMADVGIPLTVETQAKIEAASKVQPPSEQKL